MRSIFACVILIAASATAHAEQPVRRMLYMVDAAAQCSAAASDRTDLQAGLDWCQTALADPLALHRAALLVDRGVVKARLGDNNGALLDYDAAIAMDPRLGDAYASRAGVLIAQKRYDDARSDVDQALALGAGNLHVVYFSRAVIEEETGDLHGAYRDYKQALVIKPDYAAATRELARFKLVTRAARL